MRKKKLYANCANNVKYKLTRYLQNPVKGFRKKPQKSSHVDINIHYYRNKK